MQLDLSDTNLVNKFGAYLLKLSGFIFFSYVVIGGRIHYVRKWTDFVLFSISFGFSFYLAATGGGKDMKLVLKSKILNLGTVFLWKVTLISVVLTKLVNIVATRAGFEVIEHLSRIDQQVKNLKVATYF